MRRNRARFRQAALTLSACSGELQFAVTISADCRLKTGSSTMNRAPRLVVQLSLRIISFEM
jgi:hypothetical protein